MGWFFRWLLFRLKFALLLGGIRAAYVGYRLVAMACAIVLAVLVRPRRKRAKASESASGGVPQWAGN